VRPMSSSRFVTIILWVIPLALQYAIAAAILRRQLIRIFPIFFSYTALIVFRETVLFFVRYPSKSYALIYWWGDALAVLLGIGAIVEAIRHIFPTHPFLRRFLGSVWIFGIIAVVMSLLLLFSERASGPDPLLEWIILLERSARFLQACMFIVVIVLMSRFGLAGHHCVVGIVVGFGVYSAVELAGLELRGHLHYVTDVMLVRLNSVAYNLSAIIWAFYFLRPWRHDIVDHLPETDLAEWNEAVTDHIRQWHRPS
jgi:hypothetical protein